VAVHDRLKLFLNDSANLFLQLSPPFFFPDACGNLMSWGKCSDSQRFPALPCAFTSSAGQIISCPRLTQTLSSSSSENLKFLLDQIFTSPCFLQGGFVARLSTSTGLPSTWASCAAGPLPLPLHALTQNQLWKLDRLKSRAIFMHPKQKQLPTVQQVA